MRLVAHKSRLSGTVTIPGSKSHTIRALVVASLAEGRSMIRGPLASSDTLSAADSYRALGADIDTDNPDVWTVSGTGGELTAPGSTIDVGNSGTTLRLAAGSAALAGSRGIEMTGDKQIRSRPIAPLLEALNDLGAKTASLKGNGCAPIRVAGRIKGGRTSVECVTSQYLSSLLLAAPLAEKDTEIDVTLLNEPDYVQMTLDWLDKQGIDYENNHMRLFRVKGGQKYRCFDTAVPADFSSATFFLCAGALPGSDITLTGLDFSDSQPDKAVADYLRDMGANVRIGEEGVRVQGGELSGIEIDMNRTPDALPAMAVMGALAAGKTRLYNVRQARNKETDRIACMASELRKLGATVEESDDGLTVHGGQLHGFGVSGHDDHRIVMALSIAGMATGGITTIDSAESMNVTFPDYVELMKSVGAGLEIIE